MQDELGSVLGHFEGTSINQLNEYDPWGTPSVTISGDSRLLWKGLMWEGDVVSLYYMRNRWYDPESGRFLSEDPIGIDGGLNQYTFVNDDPVNGFDPAAFRGDCYYGYSYSYSRSTGKIIPGSFSISGPYGICDEPSSGPVIEGGGMAGGGQVGGPRVGRSGGGGGGRSTGTPPLKGRVNRIAGELLGCVDAHYGLTGLIGRGVVFGGALPLSKRALHIPIIGSSSRYTNPISYFGLKVFPGIKVGRQMLGSNRVFGVLGRANIYLAAALLTYDIISIGRCVAEEESQ